MGPQTAKMNIHITLVAYALDITPLVRSLAGPDVAWHIFRHSNKPEVIAQVDALMDEIANIYYYPIGANQGLARSWNQGLCNSQDLSADATVLLNDDIQASRDDLMILANAALSHRDYGIIEVQGFDGGMQRMQSMNFGFTAIQPIAIEKV